MNDANDTNKWANPLPGYMWSLPLGKYSEGGFGAKRKYNLHTGIDLYCKHEQPVAAVETGTVVNIVNFNSKNRPKWMNKTKAILIESQNNVVAYCNVIENPECKIGTKVQAGEIFGKVISVNKYEKKQDICMLHLEFYDYGTRKRVTWSYDWPKPIILQDPSPYLMSLIVGVGNVYKKRTQ
jgi:murein DD-endopeptidase MepM/ murein hydrolase activator NlpD